MYYILQASFHELIHFIERTGISLHARFLGYQRKEVTGLVSFFETLQSSLLINVMRNNVEVIIFVILLLKMKNRYY